MGGKILAMFTQLATDVFSWLPTIRCIRGPECSRSDAATLCFKPKSNTEPRVYCRCAPGHDSQKHRHRSHHITSFLFIFFHFYVYSKFFGSYQLKGKNNTHTHIQQLNISLFTSYSHFYYQLKGKNNTNILTRLYKKIF